MYVHWQTVPPPRGPLSALIGGVPAFISQMQLGFINPRLPQAGSGAMSRICVTGD